MIESFVQELEHKIFHLEQDIKLYETEYVRLSKEYFNLKEAITKHYNAKSNDRCWLNDTELYKAAGLIEQDNVLPPKDEFLRNCEQYYEQQCHSYPSY